MTTKKKSRPSFEVPAEVESGAQSGWVYRSGEGPEPVSSIEPDLLEAESAATATLAMAMAAVAQAVVLGMTLVAIPWTMGLRTLRTLARPR
jgi:hypothetical protein